MSKARKLADLLDSSGDVAGGKIADDSINSEHFVDGGIDDAHIGDLAATKLTGTIASGRLSASNMGSGTIPDARFPATLPAASGVNLTAVNASNLGSGTVPTARLGSGTASNTTFLRGDGSWQVVSSPLLDSPVITGTTTFTEAGNQTHTITNWSDDVSYTITPTNCTVGSVNGSGQFVVTHTSGIPSYTIRATTASLGLDDSALVTKSNLIVQMNAPTLSSPANVETSTNVVYTITSTTTSDDKLILDPGTANFTYQSVSVGSGSKVGNTVELTGFTTNNPAVTIQFTAEATYSVTAKSVNIAGTYTTSANSSADSILISNWGASGGTETTVGSYTVHTFTSSANFVVTGSKSVDYFMIAGGGGGGGWSGGGGGAGGYISSTLTATAQTYSIVIGSGGSGGTGNASGAQGANTTGLGQTAVGGGGGGTPTATSGGSGGGGGVNASGGSATSGQGYAGGTGSTNEHPWGHGGGGGASEVGNNGGPSVSRSGEGGAGIQNNLDGNNYYYGGGGGGGGHNGSGTGWSFGGIGGGGAGSSYQTGATGGGSARNSGGTVGTNTNGGTGGANTGGGAGGGAGGHNNGGTGGSGIMIIRYLT